jgi:hypothetical protein
MGGTHWRRNTSSYGKTRRRNEVRSSSDWKVRTDQGLRPKIADDRAANESTGAATPAGACIAACSEHVAPSGCPRRPFHPLPHCVSDCPLRRPTAHVLAEAHVRPGPLLSTHCVRQSANLPHTHQTPTSSRNSLRDGPGNDRNSHNNNLCLPKVRVPQSAPPEFSHCRV